MFNLPRHFVIAAGIATTMISGVEVAAAGPIAVTVENKLPVTVEVEFSGGSSVKSLQLSSGHTYPLGNVSDGATVRWVAKPRRPEDAKFAQCKGEGTVTAAKSTITLNADHCDATTASAAPKTGASNDQPPKTGSNTQTDKKPSESSASPTIDITFENKSKYSVAMDSWDTNNPGKETNNQARCKIYIPCQES